MIALSLSLPATATRAVLFFGVLLLSWPGWPQEPRPAVATVSFSLDFPQSIPDHYVLTVSSDGRAGYDSTGKLTAESEPTDPFHIDFTLSPAAREKAFDLAAKAKYFQGKVDSGKRNIASTGAKVLSYRDRQRSTQA